MPQSVYSMSEPWTPSVRPIIESRIPPELKRWRRWSNHFERDSDTIMGFDMNSECINCGAIAWEIDETHEWTAVECRSCGNSPQDAQTPKEADLRFSTRCNRIHHYAPSTSSTYSPPSTPNTTSTLDPIDERDFAALHSHRAAITHHGESSSNSSSNAAAAASSSSTAPELTTIPSSSTSATPHTRRRTLSNPPRDKRRSRGRPIDSIRQSLHEPPKPAPKWFEQTAPLKFKFVLTPRKRLAALTPAAEDGSYVESGAASAPSGSVGGGAGGGPPRLTLGDFADEPAELQKLLITSMFLMRSVPERGAPAKMMDLALVPARTTGGEHLAMRHENKGQAEVKMANGGRKPIVWKVVVEKRRM